MKKYIFDGNGNQVRFLTRSFASSLAAGEEDFALEQNKIVADYVKKNFKISPHLITRDAMGNIIVVKKVPSGNVQHDSFIFQMLGTNTEENSVNLFTVGYINYIRSENVFSPDAMRSARNIFVTKLAVQEQFQKCGIGSLMLHVLENHATRRGYDYIFLNSLRSFDIRKDITYPNAQIVRAIKKIKSDEPLSERDYYKLKSPELERFLKKSLFNRNLFFYNSNGYHELEMEFEGDYQDRVQKTNLDITSLDFGYKKPFVLYKPSDEKYALPEEFDPILTLNQSYGEKLFSKSLNYFDTSEFIPLFVEPSKKGTNELKLFLKALPPSDEPTP